jgi:hypothetical protein
VLGGDAGQGGLAALAGLVVDSGGQIGEESPDDVHVFGAGHPGGLGGGHRRQHRCQRFTGQCGARPEVGGLIEAAAGLAAADAQPVGQHVGP